MRCERCIRDGSVRRYEVDGFVGYLCTECRDRWESLRGAGPALTVR